MVIKKKLEDILKAKNTIEETKQTLEVDMAGMFELSDEKFKTIIINIIMSLRKK